MTTPPAPKLPERMILCKVPVSRLDTFFPVPNIDYVTALEAAYAKAREALNLYGKHLGWCDVNKQMPMVTGQTYTHPTDFDKWREGQPCTCKWGDVLRDLPELP